MFDAGLHNGTISDTATRRLLITLTDPDAVRLDVAGGTWLAVGLNRAQHDELAQRGANPAAGEQLARQQRDALIVLVSTGADAGWHIAAWRGLLCGAELMYSRLRNGDIVMSDHFRNVLAHIPPGDRAPGGDQLIEHYLCGWVYDRNTYAASVKRLGVGDRFGAELDADDSCIEVFDRFGHTSTKDSIADATERVEAALEAVMEPWRGDPNVAMTFSGGVDSTLLATFLDPDDQLLTMMPDTPEFAAEGEYAKAASGMLGRRLAPFRVLEADYVALLEETVDQSATPPHHYVVPALAGLYQRGESTFVFGEGADSFFGSGRGMQRVSGALSSTPARVGLRVLENVPGTIGRRARQVRGYAEGYASPVDSLQGSVARSLLFGDVAAIEEMVGEPAVNRVLAGHLEALAARVDLEVELSNSFFRHIEAYQFRQSMGDLAFLDRHLAQALGKRIVMPYTDPRVVAELLRVPAKKRYIKGMTGKWILKEVLSKRLPSYPVNKRKLATGLPFERYYESGPLTGIWDRYDMPEFIEPIPQTTVAKPTAVTWNALGHAVWSARIERNQELQPLPAIVTYQSSAAPS